MGSWNDKRTNGWMMAAAFSLLVGGVACGESEPTPDEQPEDAVSAPAVSKSDEVTDGRLLESLDIVDQEFDGDESTMVLRLVGELNGNHYFDEIEDGHELLVSIRANDGASTDFSVEATMAYTADGVGGYLSDPIDVSELLPYQSLRVAVSGTHEGGEVAQAFEFADGATTGVEVFENDPFEDAYDVNAGVIYIDPATAVPDYRSARVDGPFGLGGTEFWQKWAGGHNPTYSYSEGTDAGRKCMFASARRFEAIMADPPPALVELEENSNWSGRFFNWNDDYSHEDASGSARYSALWAWRTGLIKWISQTGKDGACFLPTYDLVEEAADVCLAKAARNDGEIEGCQAL